MHQRINKFADFGEVYYFIELGIYFGFTKPQDRAIQVHILARMKLGGRDEG